MSERDHLLDQLRLIDQLRQRQPAWKPMRKDKRNPDTILPQAIAFDCDASIIGYGGAAGGGKTDWAIGMSLMKSIRAVIYRKHFADFEKIDERFRSMVGTKNVKRGGNYMVTPQEGRGITAKRIVLASLDNEKKDKDKYQGRDYDHIIFDEVTQMKRETIEYLMQWNRSTNPNVNCQVLMTFNPPTSPEGMWVKDYFAPWLNKSHQLYGKVGSGQVLHRASIPNPDKVSSTFHYYDSAQIITHHPLTGEPLERPLPTRSITFVKASLKDNIYLRDTTYEAALLGHSDPTMAKIMLDGDFDTDFKDGILSVFKPQYWAKSVERFRQLGFMPDRKPDVVAIDAAMGGDDEMVVQVAWKIVEPNQPTRYIYAKPQAVRGSLVDSYEKQWQWLVANVKDFIEARLYVVDIVGGTGETLAALLENKMSERYGSKRNVIRFVGGRNSNWRSIDDWESGKSRPLAMGYSNDITAAWSTASNAQQFTETCISADDELQRQAMSRNYKSIEGNYALEAKESFSQRIGCSPDRADAYCMAAIGLHRYLSHFGA